MVYDRLANMATLRNVLGSLLATMIILAVMSLGIGPALQTLSGGLPILDLRITYTFTDVNELFLALGSEGLGLYSIQQMVDMVFPIMFSLTMVFAMIYLAPSFVTRRKWLRILVYVPLVGALFDYVENILIATQIASFPSLSETIILAAGFVTWAKWIVMFMSFVLLMLFLVKAISPTADDAED